MDEMMGKMTSGSYCEDGPPQVSFTRRKELMANAVEIAGQMNKIAVKPGERHLLRRMVDLLLVDE